MPDHHIRRAADGDQRRVAELAVINEMFAEDELGDFTAAYLDATSGESTDHQWFVATTPEDVVIAAAYMAPEPFADRLWNLYFIAVHPDQHGQGVGSALLGHLEGLLRDGGTQVARVLIVETSSTEQYAATRAFYLARGFVEEARIRDFYGPDDHKVVFWKDVSV